MTSLIQWPTQAAAAEPALPFSMLRRPENHMHRRLEDLQFREMTRGFDKSGGLVSCSELVRLLRRSTGQPLTVMAAWIRTRQALSFDWQACTMLPVFQFDLPAAALRPHVTHVVDELADTFDAWDLTLWFAQANAWLDGRAPVSVIDHEPRLVLEAARADRFVARG